MHFAFVNPQGNFDRADSHWTAHHDFGGQLVYVKQLALALDDLGHRVDILTRQIVDPDWPEFAAPTDSYPQHPNVRVLRFPCGPQHFLPKEELWPHLREWVGHITRHYWDEGRWPDLWTGHYADGGLSAALLQVESGVPFTFTGHSLGAHKLDGLLRAAEDEDRDAALREIDERYNFGARIAAERTSLARSAAIVTSSKIERFEQYAHPAYRDVVDVQDDRRFAVIPPGVNRSIFDAERTSRREEEVRRAIAAALERDIAPERRSLPPVVAWSRLDPKKNHVALVHAFGRVPELWRHANLIVITRGLDDPLRNPDEASESEQEVLQPLVEEVERYDLRGAITAFSLEGQDAAAALYRWAAERGGAFCLPAEHEPFGLSVIEAMTAGLPVVTTDQGGPQEITDDGRAGLLADPHDYDELAEQLLRILTDRETWQRYAERGRERALRRYSWRNTADGYARLATEIARGERQGDDTFPLPDVMCHDDAALPRLTEWEQA